MGTANGLYACASCSASLSFTSRDTHWKACGECGTMHYRFEGDVLLKKPQKCIRISNDVIRPGSSGRWRDKAFQVLGRMRLRFEDGALNLWTVLMEDGVVHYLSEGYGLYAMLVKLSPAPAVHLKNVREAGERTGLDDGQKATLESISRSLGYEVEGEAWDAFFQQYPVFYDFARDDGGYITAAVADSSVVVFDVYDCTFAQLQLRQLNEAEEKLKKIACPRCKKKIELVSYPYAQSYACQCGAKLEPDLGHEDEFRVHGAFGGVQPLIPLSATGVIKGIRYQVIGYAVKQDNTEYKSKWREYVLYNRQEGYAFLSEYDGHWMYSREKEVAPVISSQPEVKEFMYNGATYRLYNRYGYRITAAVGEFPGKVFGDGYSRCREFIHPPYMWVEEEDSKVQVSYYLAEHISPGEVQKAFDTETPFAEGMGPLSPPFLKPLHILLVTVAAVLLLLITHLLSGYGNTETMVLEQQYDMFDTGSKSAPLFVSAPFSLPNRRNNLEITTYADVNDTWMEADFEVVNSKTGEVFGLSQGVEYYHGYEEGESWSEGSTNATDMISNLPAGNYFLRTQLSQDTTTGQKVSAVTVRVRGNVAVHSNFYILLALLLIWPVVTYIRVWLANRARWYNSDYSPYTYE